MINAKIIDILKSLNIPVSFQKYSGNASTYITFHKYLERGQDFEDDEEYLTAHYVQVDLWTKTDYTDLVKEIKRLMISAGFKRLSEIDLYEVDTRIYHKGLKFYYSEEREVI